MREGIREWGWPVGPDGPVGRPGGLLGRGPVGVLSFSSPFLFVLFSFTFIYFSFLFYFLVSFYFSFLKT